MGINDNNPAAESSLSIDQNEKIAPTLAPPGPNSSSIKKPAAVMVPINRYLGGRSILNDKSRAQEYFHNKTASDIMIIVQPENIRIRAHRLIVGSGSARLYAILYGPEGLRHNVLVVNACSAANFNEV